MTAAIVFLCLVFPWLNPFFPGPLPHIGSLLFAWTGAAGVLLALAFDQRRGESVQVTRAIVLAWVTAAAVSAVFGLLQYFGHSDVLGLWLAHTEPGQAYGNMRQRNHFATLMNIGLAALLWLGIHYCSLLSGSPRRGLVQLALLCLAAMLLSAGNVTSNSRTGLLQLVLLTVLVWWWQRQAPRLQRRWVWAMLLSAVLAYVVGSFILPWLAGFGPLFGSAWRRLLTGDTLSCQSRMVLWDNVLHLISLKPWLGWGWGNLDYAHFISLYPGERFCVVLDNAHNLPLHLAVTLGVPAAVVLCGLLLWLLWRSQPWRARHPSRQLAWGVLAVIGLHSLLEYPLWYGPFQVTAVVSLWFLYWVPKDADLTAELAPSGAKVATAYKLVAIFLTLFCNLSWWNYNLASQLFFPPVLRDSAYQGSDALAKIQKKVWLYRDLVTFQEVVRTPLNQTNAARINALAQSMLYFSPQSSIAEIILDSALLLGKKDELLFYAARYKAAFPEAYDLWLKQHPGVVSAP